MNCKNCGHPLDENGFCPNCGFAVDTYHEEEESSGNVRRMSQQENAFYEGVTLDENGEQKSDYNSSQTGPHTYFRVYGMNGQDILKHGGWKMRLLGHVLSLWKKRWGRWLLGAITVLIAGLFLMFFALPFISVIVIGALVLWLLASLIS